MTYVITDPESLRELCMRNNWFTRGTISQYDKLFEANKTDGFTLGRIAAIIWVCSGERYDNILDALIEERRKYMRRIIK